VATKTVNKPKNAAGKAKKPANAKKKPAANRRTSAKSTSPTTKDRSREKPSRTRNARDGAHTPGKRDVVTPNAVRVLHGHRRDIWGIGFVALGLDFYVSHCPSYSSALASC